jgi:hypothetical protein
MLPIPPYSAWTRCTLTVPTFTSKQEFGPRCAPSMFMVTLHERRFGVYTWRRLHSQMRHSACRLGRSCYTYPNLHTGGVEGWTATTVNNKHRRGRLVDSVRIEVYRHARFWRSTSICRVEVMSKKNTNILPLLGVQVGIPEDGTSLCTPAETAVDTLLSMGVVA